MTMRCASHRHGGRLTARRATSARVRCAGWALATLWLGGGLAAAGDGRLVAAARQRDTEAVRGLIAQKADVNGRAADGTTALHWTTYWDELETSTLLLRSGANAKLATDVGITPLYLAASNGNATLVAALLSAGADPNAVADTGVSPLMTAARAGAVDAVKALLASGADVNTKEHARGQTALMWAVSQRHPAVVAALLEGGADVQARTTTASLLVNRGELGYGKSASEMMETGGTTPLVFAARQGDVESARLLLAAGANPNDTAADGTAALVLAAHSANEPVALLLVERGANPNAAGSGYTPLHAAILRDELILIKALLVHGADPNARLAKATTVRRNGPDFAFPVTMVGATPFLIAAKFGAADIMRALAAAGADVHAASKDGMTALLAAAAPDSPDVHGTDGPAPGDEPHARQAVEAALDLGADIDAVDQSGSTALHVATARGYNSVVQLLAERGAKLDVTDRRGRTPLQIAAAPGRRNVEGQPSRLKSTEDLLRKLGAKQ